MLRQLKLYLVYSLESNFEDFSKIYYRLSQKKDPTFETFFHQEHLTNLNDSHLNEKPKDRSIFLIFLTVLSALESLVNLTLLKFDGCRTTEKEPKTLIKSLTLSSHRAIRNGRFVALKNHQT